MPKQAKKQVSATKTKAVELPQESTENLYPYSDQEDVLNQVMQHFEWWTDDNEHRAIREGGWNDVTDAYWGKLPDDWPFISKTIDPRIRTSLLEKNARLTKNNLKGKVLPREGGDAVKARINNALIEYQWDTANEDGSMQTKLSTADIDTRLNGSKFAYVYWRSVVGEDGTLEFDGNEMKPLNIRDCGMDPNCNHIRGAKWFQHSIWMPLENLELNKDMYPGYSELMKLIDLRKSDQTVSQNRRDSRYTNRIKQLKGLEDRMGTDKAFPVIEVVVEYRRDKWITFCPEYALILSIADNPYDHKKIPIAQLRYYPIDGDNIGESEVAAVLPLWKAIQAIVCGFLDEVILKMRPPLKIVEGAARIETLVYQPEAQWLMDNLNAVEEMQSNGESVRYFQNTYPALVAAFNQAMGDLSQGVSNIDPRQQGPASATEIRQIAKQQNTRDQKNQQELAEFIKDIVSMWIVNNRQFLFRDKKKQEFILRVVGGDTMSYLKRAGLDETYAPAEALQEIGNMMGTMMDQNVPVSDTDISTMMNAVQIPKFPVVMNPEEQNPANLQIKPKMTMSDTGDMAELSVLPEDLDGTYDFVPDMKSMENTAGDQQIMAITQAMTTITNPNVITLLQQENVRPLMKELLISLYEGIGLQDAQKYFETQQPQSIPAGQPGSQPPTGTGPTGSVLPPQSGPGMVPAPQAPTQPSLDQQMARPNGV